MTRKVLAVLLLAACGAFLLPVHGAPDPGSETIYEEADFDDGAGGTIHDVRETDARCRFERNTDTFPDGTSSTVLDDYQDGKGVVLTSNNTEECLVRDLDTKDKDEAATCKDGMVEREADKGDSEQRDYVRGDVALTQDEVAELPEAIRDACVGKQVFRLVPQTQGEEGEDDALEGQVRRKRAARRVIRCHYRYRCYTYCYTRWWRRICRRRCQVYRYCYYTWCFCG